MSAGWDRLEGMIRSEDLTGGLQAHVADPLWMLAQQRRVGEFLGDDAAEPIAVRMRARHTRIATMKTGRGGMVKPYPGTQPWEKVVEQTAEPDFGAAGLFATSRAAARLIRMLQAHGHSSTVDSLRRRFPLRHEGTSPTVDLLARWSVNVSAVAAANDAELGLDPAALAVVTQWRQWLSAGTVARDSTSWSQERMEYSCSVAAATPHGEAVLMIREHTGGPLDWFSCDLSTDPADTHGLTASAGHTTVATSLPATVRYHGMPASRWFEFEDGAVNFGDIEAGPADLARLLVAEFATIFGNDWYMVPLRTPAGSLVRVVEVEVFDAFGGRVCVPSTARADFERVGSARAWRMFELTGDEPTAGPGAPWLFAPPSLASSLEGPVLERVTFARDEAANLAWGIEQLIEGPLGRAVDRASQWDARTASPASEESTSDGPQNLWRYRLGGEAPPWWIPFVAERVDPDSAQIRLRRGRLQSWAELTADADLVGPHSQLLDPRRPRWLFEEEIPTGGVRVERRWQAARWHDGSLHAWLQQRKRPGRAERGSGLRWDLLRRPDAPQHPAS